MNISLSQELKGLRSRLAEAEGEYAAAMEEVRAAQRRASAAQNTVTQFEARIAEIEAALAQSPDPSVSEHAVLRYVERVMGVDIAQVRANILTEPTRKAIAFARTGKHKRDDCTVVFKDNVVVTVGAP